MSSNTQSQQKPTDTNPGPKVQWGDLESEAVKVKTNRFITSILSDVKDPTEQVRSDRKQVYQLALLLSSDNKDLRIGAFKGMIKFLEDTTDLSKSDVKAAAKTLVPATAVSQPQSKSNRSSKKGQIDPPEILAIKARFPDPSSRGKDSEYSKEIRKAREELKKKKKLSS
jgi:hypothetical protein